MISYTVVPPGKISGVIEMPGDKSITHRAYILSSLAKGKSILKGVLRAEDCDHTRGIMEALGVNIEQVSDTEFEVEGVGLKGLKAPKQILDVGNSGTGIRLLSGLLAAQNFSSTITGDASIQKRPMKRVVEPLTKMGAKIESKNGNAPLTFAPAGGLQGIFYPMPVSSAQVKSCLMLAGLYALGETVVVDPGKSRDHTEKMFELFEIPYEKYPMISEGEMNNGDKITVSPLIQDFKARVVQVPGDFSSAAFFISLALIHPNAELTIKNVGLNDTRRALLDIYLKMGADIKINYHAKEVGEPYGDLIVKTSQLKGIEISGEIIPKLIDEIPIFCVVASQASTPSVVKNAEELKVKESDRIATTVSELKKFGVDITATPDGMIINPSSKIHAAKATSHGDHRIAMSSAILATLALGESEIIDIECVNTSFPNFWALLEKICR
jgi:3-phosphoshikimate 1-carboxyvinyltransferase